MSTKLGDKLRGQKGLALLVLVVCGVGAFWLGMSRPPSPVANGGLVVSDADLNFGEAWETNAFERSLQIKNTTTKRISISGFSASCGCLAVAPKTLTLLPGATTPVRINLDLHWGKDGRINRDFAVRIVPIIENSVSAGRGWVIRGRVKKGFSFSPPKIFFKKAIIRGEPLPSKTVVVNAHGSFVHIEATCRPEHATLSMKRSEGPNSFELNVTPSTDLPVGEFDFPINIKGIDESGNCHADGIASAVGTVTEKVAIVPSSIHFGVGNKGAKRDATIVMEHISGKGFEIRDIDIRADGVSVNRIERANADYRAFRVRQEYVRYGRHSGMVVFTVALAGRELITLELPLYYYAKRPEVARLPQF